jgi:endonuclease
MQEEPFRKFLEEQGTADKTIQMRLYALKRIERHQNLDLDAEFERDQLTSLSDLLRYGADDERAARPNPTRLNIEPDRLRSHLAWYRSHLQSYRRFKSLGHDTTFSTENWADEMEAAEITESIGQSFALERDMQAALRANLGQLEPGLTSLDGGNELRVEAGFIDILAKDSNGTATVIELKADVARPAVIAQVLAYMGCIAEKHEKVRGIVVAADFDKRVELAARAIPNLTLKRYKFRFEFT